MVLLEFEHRCLFCLGKNGNYVLEIDDSYCCPLCYENLDVYLIKRITDYKLQKEREIGYKRGIYKFKENNKRKIFTAENCMYFSVFIVFSILSFGLFIIPMIICFSKNKFSYKSRLERSRLEK